ALLDQGVRVAEQEPLVALYRAHARQDGRLRLSATGQNPTRLCWRARDAIHGVGGPPAVIAGSTRPPPRPFVCAPPAPHTSREGQPLLLRLATLRSQGRSP